MLTKQAGEAAAAQNYFVSPSFLFPSLLYFFSAPSPLCLISPPFLRLSPLFERAFVGAASPASWIPNLLYITFLWRAAEKMDASEMLSSVAGLVLSLNKEGLEAVFKICPTLRHPLESGD